MEQYGEKCVDAAQTADAASSNAAEGGSSAGAAPDALNLMIRLRNVNAHGVAANKVALVAEQAKDVLEREVQDLERVMKRPRTRASTTKDTEGMTVDVDMWDLGHRWWETTHVRNLRNNTSSTWHAAVGSITRIPSSTTASTLLWSSGGSTEWRKMPRVSHLRSGTQHKTQMPRSHQWL